MTAIIGLLSIILGTVLPIIAQKKQMQYFADNAEATQKSAIAELPLSRRVVQGLMKKLSEDGYLEHVGSRKSGRWVVKYKVVR